MKTRKEIDFKYKIDTKDLFKSDEEFNKEIKNVNSILNDISKHKDHILDSDVNLLETLDLDVLISERIERLYLYAHLHNDFDLADQNANELIGKAMKVYQSYSAISSFIVPEITAGDYETIESYINKNADLKKYKRNLKELFRLKDHILTKDEEKILSKISESFSLPEEVHTKLLDSDLTFESIKDSIYFA